MNFEKGQFVSSLKSGDHVEGVFLITSCAQCVNNKGKPYLNIELQDCTGSADAKKWDVFEGDLDILHSKRLAFIEGEANEYNGKVQIKIVKAAPIDASIEEMDNSLFAINAPVKKEDLVARLNYFLDSFTNEDIKKMVNHLIEKNYKAYIDYPAATRNHHNYVSGLLYHSLCMAKLAEKVASQYKSLNKDLLIGGCLIHDIGKVKELSGPLATEYTTEGRLLGHISIGQAEVRMAAKELGLEGTEIALLLEHMIISHHGQSDYGSPIAPETREALALSIIDDFDAKMAMLDNVFSDMKPGEWSERLKTMDNRMFYLPKFDK